MVLKIDKDLTFTSIAVEETNGSINEIYKITVFNDMLINTTHNKNIIAINSNDELNKLINEFGDVLVNLIDEVSISCSNPHKISLINNKTI